MSFPTSIIAEMTPADLLFGELSHALEMVERLQADLDRGKEPDGLDPKWTRSDRGRRMTMALVKERLRHIKLRIEEGQKKHNADVEARRQ